MNKCIKKYMQVHYPYKIFDMIYLILYLCPIIKILKLFTINMKSGSFYKILLCLNKSLATYVTKFTAITLEYLLR